MSDDQERRISELERHIETLFRANKNEGERLAVLEASHERMADDLRHSRESFEKSIEKMQNDFKESIQSKQEEQHKRTTLRLGVLTFVAAIVVPFATVVFQSLFADG